MLQEKIVAFCFHQIHSAYGGEFRPHIWQNYNNWLNAKNITIQTLKWTVSVSKLPFFA